MMMVSFLQYKSKGGRGVGKNDFLDKGGSQNKFEEEISRGTN